MKGYVENTGTQAYFILQRQLPPGGKIQLEDAYRVVGKRSGLEETQIQEFVNFLKTQIFTRGNWSFVIEGSKSAEIKPKKSSQKKVDTTQSKTSSKKEKDARGAGRSMRRDVSESQGTNITPAEIIEAPYEQARSLIEKTKDKVVLKKALNLTKHFANKEQHMRHLVKRLEQVY